MTNEEAIHRVEELIGIGDYDNAFCIADNISEDPWRSRAFELMVEFFLSPGFLERLGVDAIKQTYLVAKNYILDTDIRVKSFLSIANVASDNNDWETTLAASRQAAFEVFYN